MENIVKLEVINKSISIKFRRNNYVSADDVYKFNFSNVWKKFLGENARLQVTYLIDNERQDAYYNEPTKVIFSDSEDYDSLKDYTSNVPKELFTEENKGKTVYIGVCGIHEDGTIYPSVYCRLGAIHL